MTAAVRDVLAKPLALCSPTGDRIGGRVPGPATARARLLGIRSRAWSQRPATRADAWQQRRWPTPSKGCQLSRSSLRHEAFTPVPREAPRAHAGRERLNGLGSGARISTVDPFEIAAFAISSPFSKLKRIIAEKPACWETAMFGVVISAGGDSSFVRSKGSAGSQIIQPVLQRSAMTRASRSLAALR